VISRADVPLLAAPSDLLFFRDTPIAAYAFRLFSADGTHSIDHTEPLAKSVSGALAAASQCRIPSKDL
jgi:hypothetical protein